MKLLFRLLWTQRPSLCRIKKERLNYLNSVDLIKNLMSSSNLSVDAAMDALKIPEEKRAKYRAMVTNK